MFYKRFAACRPYGIACLLDSKTGNADFASKSIVKKFLEVVVSQNRLNVYWFSLLYLCYLMCAHPDRVDEYPQLTVLEIFESLRKRAEYFAKY